MLEKIKTCNNKCIFCFIDQLPDGLRSTLYLKDDDYLSSFQYGNFITLTNLDKEDVKNITRYKLEPLNVSLHSIDNKIREKLFGNRNHEVGISNLKRLDSEGISTNIQIVLCPDINDNGDLCNTLVSLLDDYENIISVGIVPVGMTKFNKNRELKSIGKDYSIGFIERIDEIKSGYDLNNKIFISDEFYIIAEKVLPDADYYGDFPQIQNGIGKVSDFLKQSAALTEQFIKEVENKKVKLSSEATGRYLFMTSEYGLRPLSSALIIIAKGLEDNSINFPKIEIKTIKNRFFGGNVRVTGLLSGKDITSNIRFLDLERYEKVFIPDCIFNENGLTIDGYDINEIKNFSEKIEVLKEDFSDIFKKILF